MKTTMGRAALAATFSTMQGVLALEHPLLASTHDFQETWKERTSHDDMISQHKEQRFVKKIDSTKRPVIGVLTEPIRGDLYEDQEQIEGGVDNIPGYVPRAHV